jgi:hypothetical protein
MRIDRIGGVLLALLVISSAGAQETNLTRAEVAAIKAKLVTVQQAMGADPTGYMKETEDFTLPTEFNPNTEETGRFWPIGSGVYVRYGDRAAKELEARMEDLSKRYTAAAASVATDPDGFIKLTEEFTRVQQEAAAQATAPRKEQLTVNLQFNTGAYAAIDPDAVVFERSGVIALRDSDVAGERGTVTVYLDPVALAQTETLSSLELKTPDNGVTNKTGVFNVQISLQGTIADAEAWAQTFDTAAMLSVIDSQ